MQFSFTTIVAALAMATITEAQYACEYIEALGGACNGYYPLECQFQESPYPGAGKAVSNAYVSRSSELAAILNRGCGALGDLQRGY
ncbi:hypothetical protein F5Y03DRAFT_400253 [Xylaria venustula]|nr:hypothetical protein F5Y03DRAFT_400253 [Xylaria venustula]